MKIERQMSSVNQKLTDTEKSPAFVLQQKMSLEKAREKENMRKEAKQDQRQCFIFYPIEENSDYKINPMDEFKTSWDLYITLVLIFSSFVIPYRVAFIEFDDETRTWIVINSLIDLSFAFDIVVVFNTAYYDDNFKIVERRK